MACKPSCGSDRETVEMLIESAITKALKDGTLQGALKDCEGSALSTGTKVVLCNTLAAQVNSLIKDGSVDVVTDVAIKDGKVVVTMGDGTTSEIELPAVKSVAIQNGKLVVTEADGSKTEMDIPQGTADLNFDATTNKLSWTEDGREKSVTLPYVTATVGTDEVTLTLPNGGTISVPKAGSAITGDDFDYTIVKGANQADKYGVKLGANSGLKVGTDGIAIKMGDSLTTDANGNLIVNNNVAPETMTALDTGTYKLGFHTFTGSSEDTSGLPENIYSEDKEQGSRTDAPSSGYDYNGYYIASSGQVDVWLQGVNSTAWYIMNDGGVNSDGTLKTPSAWGKWQKLDNSASITNEMVKKMQEQLNALATQLATNDTKDKEQDARLTALEEANDETCKVPVRYVTSDYTLVDDDNVVITSGSNAVTVTVPTSIPAGRMFTLIQGGTGAVKIANGGFANFFAPRDGSLKLGGLNAAVTILMESSSSVRILGDTEAA